MALNHCIINLSTSEGRWRMRHYLTSDMSIIGRLILYAATCHKHQWTTALPDILNLAANTFAAVTHDWCTVQPSWGQDYCWAKLFIWPFCNHWRFNLSEALVTVKMEKLGSVVGRCCRCFPLTCRHLWLQLEVIASFKNGCGQLWIVTIRCCSMSQSVRSQVSWQRNRWKPSPPQLKGCFREIADVCTLP